MAKGVGSIKVKHILQGGDITIDSDKCGGFGCFYDPGNIQLLAQRLKKLTNIRKMRSYTSNRDFHVTEAGDMSRFFDMIANAVQAYQLGVRVEGVTRNRVAETLNVMQTLQKAYRHEINEFTTYYPVPVQDKKLHFTIIELENPIKYRYKRGELYVDHIVLTYQQNCASDLFTVIQRGCDPATFERYMVQIKESLNRLHAVPGFYHGDIKFENMVYCPSDKCAKLIDYPGAALLKEFKLPRIPFVHTWRFDNDPNPPANVTRLMQLRAKFADKARQNVQRLKQEKQEYLQMTNVIDAQMYDRVCINVIIAMYILHSKAKFRYPGLDIKLYNRLHYPDASQYIVKNFIVVAPPNRGSTARTEAPLFIRQNKLNIDYGVVAPKDKKALQQSLLIKENIPEATLTDQVLEREASIIPSFRMFAIPNAARNAKPRYAEDDNSQLTIYTPSS